MTFFSLVAMETLQLTTFIHVNCCKYWALAPQRTSSILLSPAFWDTNRPIDWKHFKIYTFVGGGRILHKAAPTPLWHTIWYFHAKHAIFWQTWGALLKPFQVVWKVQIACKCHVTKGIICEVNHAISWWTCVKRLGNWKQSHTPLLVS